MESAKLTSCNPWTWKGCHHESASSSGDILVKRLEKSCLLLSPKIIYKILSNIASD